MASSSNATSQIHSSSSQQVFLLYLIFPGFTALSSSVWPLLTDAPSLYGRLLCICGLLVLIGRYGSKCFKELLETYFTSKIEVPYNDEAYDMLILWVRSQPFARSARASLATVNLRSSTRLNRLESNANKKPLRYSPVMVALISGIKAIYSYLNAEETKESLASPERKPVYPTSGGI